MRDHTVFHCAEVDRPAVPVAGGRAWKDWEDLNDKIWVQNFRRARMKRRNRIPEIQVLKSFFLV